jgi:hypothetical protein
MDRALQVAKLSASKILAAHTRKVSHLWVCTIELFFLEVVIAP